MGMDFVERQVALATGSSLEQSVPEVKTPPANVAVDCC